ncbi:MAG: outer membrane protein [Pseudolabrys sp.]
MRRTVFVAVTIAAMSSPVVAADMARGPYYAPQAPVTGYNWAGLYAGVNLGYQWGTTTNNPTSPAGVAGGGQIGYNWQSGQFVFGGETDLQISGAEDTFAPWKFSNPWFGTLRGRAGIAFNAIMVYGTLGLAYGDVRGEIAGLSETKTHIGWAGGVGVEVGLNRAWSARAEYLYVDLNDRLYTITGVKNGLESNLLRLGVNYRF